MTTALVLLVLLVAAVLLFIGAAVVLVKFSVTLFLLVLLALFAVVFW